MNGDAAVRRAVMEGVSAAVAVVDGEFRVVEANAAWRAIGPATGADWRDVVHPADRGLIPGRSNGPVELRVRTGEGGVRWCSLVVRPAGEGEAAGAAVVLTDIDGLRAAEAERAALHRIAGGISREGDLAALLERVAAEIGELLQADGAGVARFEPEGGTALLLGRWAPDPALLDATPDRLRIDDDGTTALVFRTGRPARVDYGARGGHPTLPWSAAVAVPIWVGAQLWGALGAVAREGHLLTEDVEDRLERFAELAGLAVANAEARDRLLQQAMTDPLTGLAHHGTFHRALEDEIARAERFGGPLSLAVVDIDHFKDVNDDHGHEVGDATLRAIAERLAEHARAVDLVARVGGEEFAWLMPGTPLAGARQAAERFRAAIAATRFGPVPALTVSVGVAQLTEDDLDASSLFRRADGALYAAKSAGRDRTMAAGTG